MPKYTMHDISIIIEELSKNHTMIHGFNNVAEYQALILGLQMAMAMGIKDLDVYGDSQLILNQLLEEFEVKKDLTTPH